MRLSILVPSIRPEGLSRFEESVRNNSVTDDVEIIVLVDDNNEYVEEFHNKKIIHCLPQKPVFVSRLAHECYKHATGDWVMFANDDIICETPEWDKMLFGAIAQYAGDGIALFWPDDCMFGVKLACFPIISKKFLDMTGFFPQPYQRYKFDDTLYHLVPNQRKYFLSNIKFRHYNDEGTDGFSLEDGRVYPINREAAEYDNNAWVAETANRQRMRKIVHAELKIDIPRVVIGVCTQEMARRADFYDCIDAIQNPPNVEIFRSKVHAQSPAKARNVLIEEAINKDCTHVLLIDDDVFPPPDVVSKLLSHNKDVVTGLYLSRAYPHRPYIFDSWLNGGCTWYALKPEDDELIEIVACGLGCCLIKTDVFKAMEKPWIRLGELEADNWCDDIGFFKRVGEAGFKMYCDTSVRAGHVSNMIVHPKKVNGQWFTSYWTATAEGEPMVPQTPPKVELTNA